VNGSVKFGNNFLWDNINSLLTIVNSGGTRSLIRLNNKFSDLTKLQFTQEFSAGTFTEIGYIGNTWGTGMELVTSQDLIFKPGNTEKVRFTSAGNLGIGTTTPTEKLEVNGNVKISGNLTTSPTYTNCGLLSPIGVAENTTETIGFAAKIDPNGWWNPGTKRWTPTVPGFYFVTLQVRWDIGTLGNQINIQILKNLATVGIAQDLLPTNTGLTQTTSAIIEMNGSTDYVTFTGYTSSTTGEFIHGEPQGNWTFFNAFKIN
jgi:hypothetical protein